MSILSSNLSQYDVYEPTNKQATLHGPHVTTSTFIRKYYGANASDIRSKIGTPTLALMGLNSDGAVQGRSNDADRITRFDPSHRYLGFLKNVSPDASDRTDAHFVFNIQAAALDVPVARKWENTSVAVDSKIEDTTKARAASISTNQLVHNGPLQRQGAFPRTTVSLGMAIVNGSSTDKGRGSRQ